jgi:hypothetical protein
MFLGFWWVKENTPRLAIYSRNGGKASRVCPRIRHHQESTGLRPHFLDTTIIISIISINFQCIDSYSKKVNGLKPYFEKTSTT